MSSSPEVTAVKEQKLETPPILEVLDLGKIGYNEALKFQKSRVQSRVDEVLGDTLLLAEHPPVITLGLRAKNDEIHISEEELKARGVEVAKVGRGGMATFHGPGQLVAYPIMKLKRMSVPIFVDKILSAIEYTLSTFGIKSERNVNGYGVWVNGAKIASVGLALQKWVTYHGVALNVNTDLNYFNMISPCGNPTERITSMQQELGHELDYKAVSQCFVEAFAREFERSLRTEPVVRRPSWFHLHSLNTKQTKPMERMITDNKLHTVCQEAMCPNKAECFASGTSTFIIMGDICTRNCRYCAVTKGKPLALDQSEPENVANAVEILNLKYAVITSVTRDDLEDGGAGHFVQVIEAIRKRMPSTSVEVLVPDFNGDTKAIDTVCDAKPDMFNHNIETVRSLFTKVRPIADYQTSLEVLEYASKKGLKIKSGVMLGLGESWDDIRGTLNDLYSHGCRYLTLGQYLAPSRKHAPIARFVAPDEFNHWKEVALEMGFEGVASAPLVRSSYRAEAMANKCN